MEFCGNIKGEADFEDEHSYVSIYLADVRTCLSSYFVPFLVYTAFYVICFIHFFETVYYPT